MKQFPDHLFYQPEALSGETLRRHKDFVETSKIVGALLRETTKYEGTPRAVTFETVWADYQKAQTAIKAGFACAAAEHLLASLVGPPTVRHEIPKQVLIPA